MFNVNLGPFCYPPVYCLIPANVFWGSFVTPSIDHVCKPPEDATAVDECYYVADGDNTTLLECVNWEYDKTYFTNSFTSQVS